LDTARDPTWLESLLTEAERDAMTDRGYVDAEYLRLADEQLAEVKQRSYTLMQLRQPAHVIDIGCGPGTDTVPLAGLVGAGGSVVGIDSDPDMIALASSRVRERHLSNVNHHVGNALELPFDDATFDACRSERLFQHLSDPAQALSEMIRVTKPGGRVVVVDTDWGTLSFDSIEGDIERRLARVHAESVLRNGYAGRQLLRLFKEQSLRDVHVEVAPAWSTDYRLARIMTLLDETERSALQQGIVSSEELRRWHAIMKASSERGTFFVSLSVVLLAAQCGGT
jgi:SAM-dependent methyltransferase